MRGGYLHNTILLQPLEREFRSLGASTRLEMPTGSGKITGYIDLLVNLDSKIIAVEAELSSKRISRDLQKAHAVNADELWVVVPNNRVAQAVRQRFRNTKNTSQSPPVFILTQGQALQRLRNYFPLFSRSNVGGKQKRISPGVAPKKDKEKMPCESNGKT